jgi:formate hydrogenlyase subunit 3/multisubunit Na+/H+ antiporter MnhD subunit
LLGWLAGAQVGLVVLALGLEGPLGRMAVHALLVNLALTTLAGALVVMMVERITGSDDFTLVVAGDKLRVPGIIWGLAALSALGVPSSWGFWGRSWLFHAASEQAPWVVPLVLGASVLLALAYLAPLARFRGGDVRGQSPAEESTRTGSGLLVPVLLAGALLVLTGLVPQALWEAGLSGIPGAPRSLPVTGEQHALTVVLALASGVAALLWLRLPPRPTLHDEDMTPVVLAPDGLGHQLGALAFAARPIPAGHGIWQGMLALGNVVRRAMVLFEKRYYLVGVLLAVLSLILVMAQG